MIPKIIHQTWKTDIPPSKWIPFIEKVKKLNPEWEYILWTDADNDEFVKQINIINSNLCLFSDSI